MQGGYSEASRFFEHVAIGTPLDPGVKGLQFTMHVLCNGLLLYMIRTSKGKMEEALIQLKVR